MVVGERSAGSGALLLERLAALRGGAELLRLAREWDADGRERERDARERDAREPDARERQQVALVGGAVRDLLIERDPRELDVVLGADEQSFATAAAAFAGELAARIGGQVRAHERFGTALVSARGVQIDVAARRAESYSRPGALPDVRPGGEQEDLSRRDFTVNAIALPLNGTAAGELRPAPHALADLEQRVLRVMHRGSFLDDPTRIVRLHRYAARLRFALETETARLAADALCAGALDTVSPARIGAELRLTLREPDVVATLAELQRGGVLARLAPAGE
ncbi:MAG: tRNA nucleotidyltransferase/poly(A) polymerase family protein, partial [Solirubrobacteraceae bacterium]